MVFGGIASDDNVMHLHFIEVDLKINTVQHLKILERVVLPWIIENYDYVCSRLSTCTWSQNCSRVPQKTTALVCTKGCLAI